MLVSKNKSLSSMLSSFAKQQSFSQEALASSVCLVMVPKQNKISWQSRSPYNKRWQFKWKSAFYTYPRDGHEHTTVKKPQDSQDVVPLYWAWAMDVVYRWVPGLQCWWDRRHRMYDSFGIYLLPATSVLFYQFYDINFGFKVSI